MKDFNEVIERVTTAITATTTSLLFDVQDVDSVLITVAVAITGTDTTGDALDVSIDRQYQANIWQAIERFPSVVSGPASAFFQMRVDVRGLNHIRVGYTVTGSALTYTTTVTLGLN